jgi:NAD(P)-dependent dehydrogenase (short-subunit alcohol dehydrogenase family)
MCSNSLVRGAAIVVNDLGADVDGSGSSIGPANDVVAEILSLGGHAVVNGDDVSDGDGARRLVEQAIEEFGRLDVLVNNAGILRDRMLVNMSLDEWDDVVRVHLRGTFAPTHFAAQHWRQRAKAGKEVDARIINTTSPSGIYGNVGQTNYGAAKAGIASFTVIAAMELSRYGVTVNAVSPAAATRMTLPLSRGRPELEHADFDPRAAANISPLVVWLGSVESAGVTGRVFNVRGGDLSVAEGWRAGPGTTVQRRWDPAELGEIVPALVAEALPPSNMRGVPSPAGPT